EQTFNRYYANSLAAFIAGSMPKIKAVFEKWKTIDTAAILGNLQKNEELKLVLLQETPWVLQAQNENEQKKNIALLFDLVRLANEKNNTLKKIAEAQTSNGGFSWFKGGPDDRYITQYILTGIGHLRKLNAISKDDYSSLTPIVEKALKYLDARIKEDYIYLIKHKIKLSQNNLSGYAIQYLYMRSFFPEYPISSSLQKADNYYRSQSKKYWTGFGKYYQGMIALSLFRNSDEITAKKIINSLKENAIESEEMGMYWKDFTKRGYYWYQSPIESHSLLIEAFSDIDKNLQTVDNLKTWLLKNKQTNSWESTKATAEACYALLLKGSNWLSEDKNVTIQLGNLSLSTADDKVEAGTGYFKQTIAGNKVQQGMGNIIVTVKPQSTATSWGAVYWQYFEDLDKITTAQTPLKLVKKLFVEKNSASGPVLQVINEGDELKVGDKVVVRIELYADREMEYVHMKDMRAACMEPVNVLSSYKWQGGLGYYESTKDASTNFFFPYLPKGNFVFEYPMYVTHAGNFSNGITSIQCMYAPEFSSHSEGIRVNAIP
ncbi:MAG: alpha-2-macroglobulin, partial [Bacteroidetes bacterium]|nr:alpha-2-macroglobulin [Bacteroidota bacterium]